jgi:hypothetical protein
MKEKHSIAGSGRKRKAEETDENISRIKNRFVSITCT